MSLELGDKPGPGEDKKYVDITRDVERAIDNFLGAKELDERTTEFFLVMYPLHPNPEERFNHILNVEDRRDVAKLLRRTADGFDKEPK